MTIPLILKITGVILMLAGLAFASVSLLNGKRQGVFEGMEELRNIQSKGYTSEHREEVREDIYRREVISEQSRLLSRRAKRVLEKMERDEASTSEEVTKPAGVAKGTSVLEEVSGKTPTTVSTTSSDSVKQRKKLRPRRNTQPKVSEGGPTGTAVLDSPPADTQNKGTAILTEDRPKGTDVLPGRGEGHESPAASANGTAILAEKPSSGQGTAVLPQTKTGTDVLTKDSRPAGTDILPQTGSESRTGTDVLVSQAENTKNGADILQEKKADAEGTAILVQDSKVERAAGTKTGTEILAR